jgi:hypothetical protein
MADIGINCVETSGIAVRILNMTEARGLYVYTWGLNDRDTKRVTGVPHLLV